MTARVENYIELLLIFFAVYGEHGFVGSWDDQCAGRLLARGFPGNRVIGQRVLKVVELSAEVAVGQGKRVFGSQIPNEAMQTRSGIENRGLSKPVFGSVTDGAACG